MIRRPPRATRTDTLFPTRRSSDLDCIIWISHPGTGPSAQQFTALLSAAGAAAPMASGAPRAATVRRQRYAAATWGRGDCDQVEVLATQGVDRYSTYVAHPGIASTWIYTMGASTSPIRISLRTQFSASAPRMDHADIRRASDGSQCLRPVVGCFTCAQYEAARGSE